MNASVEQLETDWRKLVDLARQGEEILITSCGQPVAKLTGVRVSSARSDHEQWLTQLAHIREQTAGTTAGASAESILEDLRSERG